MKKRLTPRMVQEIISRYPHEPTVNIANDFGVSIYTVYQTAKRYQVKKSEAFLNSPASGRIPKGQSLSPATQFKKGFPGATKGLRIEAIIKSEEKLWNWRDKCLWKKGHKPHNTATDGEIRWRNNPGYYFIRIAENNWEFLHRYIWEQAYGEISPGFNVIFKDGNHRNCKLENLECISNRELAERNRHTKYPIELMRAIEDKNRLSKLLKQIENE